MNWKKLKFTIPLLFLLISVYLVFFEPEVLLRSIFLGAEIPVGTLVSWIGLFSYALLFFFLVASKRTSVFEKKASKVLFANLILASLWGIVSALFAGNWSFNFNNAKLFYSWIIITVFIVILPLIVYLILGIRKLTHTT